MDEDDNVKSGYIGLKDEIAVVDEDDNGKFRLERVKLKLGGCVC